jgi:hypothetical protein
MDNPKSFITTLPLLSAAAFLLGLLFDAGYFLAIDINLYTLFSLDEHILFSIEALPLVVIGILPGVIISPLVMKGAR